MTSQSFADSRFRIEGMDCASCASKIVAAVKHLPNVEEVSVSVAASTMTVRHGAGLSDAAIMRQVQALGGYRASPVTEAARNDDARGAAHGHDDSHRHEHDHGTTTAGLHGHDPIAEAGAGPWWTSKRTALTIGCGVAILAAYAVSYLAPALNRWAFMLAMAVGLLPIARRAFAAARFGTPFSIEMLMVIASVGATIIGANQEAAAVVFLFLIGELLEGVATAKARASIRSLSALVPQTALVERDGKTAEVPAEQLRIGSVILVRPGDRIAADGEILDGTSAIDEAPVTGESTPKTKTVGGAVFAGTINTDGVLRVRVTATSADNTIARVVRLVEEAQESKAPTERFIDRFARYYTPGVVAVAAFVAILPPLLTGGNWDEWVYKGLAILLIGCPCALVISTPAAIAASLSAGARRGLLLKGGAVLEILGSIDVIALDKTGTLTEGRPKVTDIVAIGRSERDILSMAAALETGSSHPLARAILEKARLEKVPIPPAASASAVPGKGVMGQVGGARLFLGAPKVAIELGSLGSEAAARIDALNGEGKSVSVLLEGESVAGIIAMRDEPRADAKIGIDALKALGIQPLMLTGDNGLAAAAVGKSLGLEVRAELLPEDKQRIVRELQARGRKVAKVGDGINDAPALAAADVGIAMGGGTDVALETADAAVLHGRVLDLARMVSLSRRTMRNIHENITIALGLKAVFLVTTILGVTGLWPAILADTGATVLVTMNALRLLRVPA